MDDIFERAEIALRQATSSVELKRAVARLLFDIFGDRASARARMIVVMAQVFDMHSEVDKQRSAAQKFVHLLHDETRNRDLSA